MSKLSASAAEFTVEVQVHAGIIDAIDDAAARADPRHAFLRRAWFEAACRRGATTIVALRGDGRVIATLPTAPVGPAAFRMRGVLGSYWPFRSFPVAVDATDAELVALLASPTSQKALGKVWRLGPVYDSDPTAARLIRLAEAGGWSVVQRRIATSFLFDVDEARASGAWPRASTLSKNRYYERKLAREGELEWRFVSGSGWTDAIFDDLSSIERKSWLGTDRGGDAKFLDPTLRSFWKRAIKDPVIAEMLSVAILYVGGEPISFSFGIDAGSTRYCIATSYDEAFAEYRPGTAASYRAFAEAVARGVCILDRGAGDGGHKSSMGAVRGPRIMDYLLVRGPLLARLLRPLWEHSARKRSILPPAR